MRHDLESDGRLTYRLGVLVLALLLLLPGAVGPTSTVSAADRSARFVPVPPTRLIDTRTHDNRISIGAASQSVLEFGLKGPVDPAASAVAINVVVTGNTGPGFVQVGATSTFSVGNHSNINIDSTGRTIAGLVVVDLEDTRSITLHSSGGGHMVVDLVGYFVPDGASTSGRFRPLETPRRALDTRLGIRTKFEARSTRPLGVRGPGATVPLPDDAAAIVANVTAVDGEAPGFIQLYPSGESSLRGRTSSVNYTVGEVAPNLVIVPIGENGSIDIYSLSPVHVLVDVMGYFTGPSADSSDEGLFVAVPPKRLVDTRTSSQAPATRSSYDINRLADLPGETSAVMLNAAIVNSATAGYLQLVPSGTNSSTSNVNVTAPGRTRANAVLAPGHDGEIDVLNTAGGDHLLDIFGYFTRSTPVTIDLPRSGSGGFVVPQSELMAKPVSGSGWDVVRSTADSSWGEVDLGDQNSRTQTKVLAGALVYARTGDSRYRDKVIEHVRRVCGTHRDGPDELLALARTLFGYVAAAETVGMDHDTTCTNGQTWRAFLESIRDERVGDHGRWRTLRGTSADTANNWGAYALSSHLAVSIALDDRGAIARDVEIFKRFLGDPTSTAPAFQPTSDYIHNNGAMWDMSPTMRSGINPASTDPRSGALIEDALRGSSTPSVTCCAVHEDGITYQEETLDALVAITEMLRTRGIDLRNSGDQALRRAYEFMIDNGGPGPYSLSRYLPYAINHLYGTNHPTQSNSRPYRHLGYGSWLFAP